MEHLAKLQLPCLILENIFLLTNILKGGARESAALCIFIRLGLFVTSQKKKRRYDNSIEWP